MNLTARQRGSVIIMALFAVGTALAAFTAVGLGQMMWQKRQIQAIADIAARTAAAQLGDVSNNRFPIADQLATNNGRLPTDNLSYICLNANNQPVTCVDSSGAVQVTITRTVKPFFFGRSTTLTAVATAEPAPIISATLASSVLTLDTTKSEVLKSILGSLGIATNVEVLKGINGLLGLDLDVLTITNALNVTSPQSLLKLSVGEILGNPAIPIANLELRDLLSRLRIPLGDILLLDLTQADAAQARINLGQLAINGIIGSVQGNAVRLNLTSLPAGLSVKLYVTEPPQMLVARQRRDKPRVGFVRSGQVKLEFNFERSITNLLTGGLNFPLANISLLRGGIYVQAGGAEVQVDRLVCKMPRSNVQTYFTPKTALASVCLSGMPANFADRPDEEIRCGGPAEVLTLETTLLNPLDISQQQKLALKVLASAETKAESEPKDQTISPAMGKDPAPISIFNQTGPTLRSLLSNLKIKIDVQSIPSSGFLSFVSLLLQTITSTLTSILNGLLGDLLNTVGQVSDSVFQLLGIDVNSAIFDIQRVDCSGTRLIQTNP